VLYKDFTNHVTDVETLIKRNIMPMIDG